MQRFVFICTPGPTLGEEMQAFGRIHGDSLTRSPEWYTNLLHWYYAADLTDPAVYYGPDSVLQDAAAAVKELCELKEGPIEAPALKPRLWGEANGLSRQLVVKRFGEQMVQTWERGEVQPPAGQSESDMRQQVGPFLHQTVWPTVKRRDVILLVEAYTATAIRQYTQKPDLRWPPFLGFDKRLSLMQF